MPCEGVLEDRYITLIGQIPKAGSDSTFVKTQSILQLNTKFLEKVTETGANGMVSGIDSMSQISISRD